MYVCPPSLTVSAHDVVVTRVAVELLTQNKAVSATIPVINAARTEWNV